jgi:hypothetical protein
MIQSKYTTIPQKNLHKKENLKNYSLELFKRLKNTDFKAIYGTDYISEHGITLNDISDLIRRIEHCSETTVYENNVDINEHGEISDNLSILESTCCHEYNVCPLCASVKRNHVMRYLKPVFSVIKKVPELHTYMGTITIRGSSNAAADYQKLRQSWTRFIKMGQRRSGGRSCGESSKIVGSLLSIEIVPELGNDKNYHVHGHVVLVCNAPLSYVIYDQDKKRQLSKIYGKYIPKKKLDEIVIKKIMIPDAIDDKQIYKEIAVSKLSEEWYDASGSINFWVKPLKERYIDGKQKSVENQLYEVVKYATKSWELDTLQLIDLWGALKGKRRITRSGIFTANRRAQFYLREILSKNGLLEQWDNIKPEEFEENDFDFFDDKKETKTYLQLIYDTPNRNYFEKDDHTNYDYKTEEVYKQYQREKCKILTDYRSKIAQHKTGLLLMRTFNNYTTESKLQWIEQKELIKKDMRLKIRQETAKIKEYIEKYQIKKRTSKLKQKTIFQSCLNLF